MNLIAAVDKNWAIGRGGRLLVNIPEDIKLFRMETAGKAAIMGRKTYENISEKTSLIERDNIVLTSDKTYKNDNVKVAHSVEEVLEYTKDYESSDIYVIGGASVFEQFLPYCNTAHITYIDYKYDADSYMPDLDKLPEWSVTRTSDEHTYFDICYEFREYKKA